MIKGCFDKLCDISETFYNIFFKNKASGSFHGKFFH